MNVGINWVVLGVAAALWLSGCSKQAQAPPAGAAATSSAAHAGAQAGSNVGAHAAVKAHDAAGIAWRHASNSADVDTAFEQARTAAKPVFVYWGAAWCPPCNQVKATLFNRQDFIERTRAFVPIYVDGDSPGAQKLGARFHVSGYPTMVLFGADGTEVTRLPGEVEPARYLEVITLGMNARRPVKSVLADALAGGQGLVANDWRLLAFYSWDTDEQQLVDKRERAALLQRLAETCPAAEAGTAMRLRLLALAAAAETTPVAVDPAGVEAVIHLLDDDRAARDQFDVLVNNAAAITRALSARGTSARGRLLLSFDRALVRFEGDATLSQADRIGALIARVDLTQIDAQKIKTPAARITKAKLEPALLADVRSQVARADRETTDGYERQAVITAAADLLGQAGLMDESDALLKANLTRSHSPYYLMTELAENAARRGDRQAALRWHEEAFEQSVGAATRLQWGARYIGALIDLAPDDEARIERASNQVLAEAAKQPDVFYERNARALRRVSTKLRDWNHAGAHAAVVRRFDTQLGAICGRLDGADPQRATCTALLKKEVKAAA